MHFVMGLSGGRIRLEAEAVLSVIDLVEVGMLDLLSSDALRGIFGIHA